MSLFRFDLCEKIMFPRAGDPNLDEIARLDIPGTLDQDVAVNLGCISLATRNKMIGVHLVDEHDLLPANARLQLPRTDT